MRYKLSEPFPAFNSGQSAILRLGVCKFSPGGRLPNRTQHQRPKRSRLHGTRLAAPRTREALAMGKIRNAPPFG